jgi:hypothetical protein
VQEPSLIQGRLIGAAEVEQIRHWLADHPAWSRRRLSEHLANAWAWRNPAGRLKDMAARTLLLKLEQRGWITLPPRRRAPPNRMRQNPPPALEVPPPSSPLTGPLAALLPLTFTEVSPPAPATQRTLFQALLHHHHYLGHRGCVGENLQYLVSDRQGRPVACVLFGAAAWQCADRDRFIGWSSTQRVQHLTLLVNNTRFLLLPWVQVPSLASHVLGQVAQRVSTDWQCKYSHPIYLLETFIERDRFTGACYRAANWVRVGQTRGRTRQDRPDGTWHQVPSKDVYVLPLHPRFRGVLQGTCALNPTPTP